MAIKLVVEGRTLNVISAYTPQVGLDEEVKRRFWEGEDFNGYIGRSVGGYDEVHGGSGFGVRDGGGKSLLDFAKAFNLVIANSSFQKREEHLVTFKSTTAKTQIDYLLLRRCGKGLCTDCKVILSENLTTQHKLLVMDLDIMLKRKKWVGCGRPKIRWGALTKDKAQELQEKLLVVGA
uniref:Craniofacial development protein 2-like n=1 Tax=Nicotiana sylvestris TaxID=4096 RepID=A0A1U7YXA0_NICSY|nr:PREDICTED: craniofacial development protein 2-like [Nicotiana sylvestris]